MHRACVHVFCVLLWCARACALAPCALACPFLGSSGTCLERIHVAALQVLFENPGHPKTAVTRLQLFGITHQARARVFRALVRALRTGSF